MTNFSPPQRTGLLPRSLLAFAMGLAALSQSGCHRSDTVQAEAVAARPAESIDLAAEQLSAIRIEAAQTQAFAVESETVGSISFDEDPSVVQAESNLLTASANYEMSRRELVRVQRLGEANGIAPKEYEAALAAQQTAAATLKASRDAVRALGVSEGQIDRMISANRFDAVDTDPHRKWVIVNLPESDSARVRPGQKLRVQVPAYPGNWYSGTVARVYATIDPGTHRIAVRALIEDPHNELRAGMLATVVIRFAEPVQAVAIPTTAAVRQGDGSMITWVTTDRHHFSMRPLKLGLEHQGHYQVLDGLKAEELVVTEGGVFLSNLLDAPPSD
jgi:cobalt-zinc-cadmium efflux system membrane fusion protein